MIIPSPTGNPASKYSWKRSLVLSILLIFMPRGCWSKADFSSAMKILVGHQMVHQALQDNLIPPNAMVVSLVAMPSKCPSVAVYWLTSHANATTPWL